MHTLILLTGPQGCGKTTLISLMRNAKEIDGMGKTHTEVLREIFYEKDFKETLVITATSANYVLRRMLENCANELKCNYNQFELYEKEKEITHTEAKIQTSFKAQPGVK